MSFPGDGDTSPEEDVARCLEEPKAGYCRAANPRWYYNADRQACEKFLYGGCPLTSNNFKTEESCMAACKGVKQPRKIGQVIG